MTLLLPRGLAGVAEEEPLGQSTLVFRKMLMKKSGKNKKKRHSQCTWFPIILISHHQELTKMVAQPDWSSLPMPIKILPADVKHTMVTET